jgi:hypothetical protein
MISNPLVDTLAQPLLKFQSPDLGNAGGSPIDDLPLEVQLLFGTLFLTGVVGLARAAGVDFSGSQTENDSTAGVEQPPVSSGSDPTAETENEELSQGEKERMYYKRIAEEMAEKRGGTKDRSKKRKNKK